MQNPYAWIDNMELEFSCPERDWIPDNRVNKCQLCQNDFSVANRKHHCRRCGRVVCNACSPSKLKLPGLQDEERVCVPCSTETMLFRDFKSQCAPAMVDNVKGTTTFTIHLPNRKDTTVSPVWLSESLLLICWEDEHRQVQSCRVDQFQELKEGFHSATFQSKLPKKSGFPFCCFGDDKDDFLSKEPLVFSLFFSGNWTLDLEAPSFDVKMSWILRFRALSKVVPFAKRYQTTFGLNQLRLTAAEADRMQRVRSYNEGDQVRARMRQVRQSQVDLMKKKYVQSSSGKRTSLS